MSTPPLNPQTLVHYRERLLRIGPDTPRRWGQMSPTELMAHLARTFDLGLGLVPVEDKSNLLTRTVLRWAVFHLPWPKGRVKAPPVFTPAPEGDFAAEQARAVAALERFAEQSGREPGRQVLSMVFGHMPLRRWQVLMGKHTEHHLRQFGV
ncbi:MAG: DUF1569 domain-containing protein [Candidatus Sumerlaeia bacterium]|nr:DUF1569 domain-containing protein [Candidatus Sumerlaeia bacterium]